MTQRRFPVAAAWILFVTSMLVGAGLASSRNQALHPWGLALLIMPMLAAVLFTLLYYARSWRYAQN